MKYPPLLPNKLYHIHNHATHNCNLFRSDENYDFFIEKYNFYINNIADTFAYCLMPNHFHLLVKIKNEEQLLAFKNQSSDPSKRVENIKKRIMATTTRVPTLPKGSEL